ncbi:acyl-CoA dehydrogenase family protein [Cumulibacter manganitolerans]|uniref:acyl-CoA dehydrogenase family protein n=1 Tax=Cumulibacter manganitolerans TaxID=1884992 RepID=UPI001295AB40|nr:acyl-CoA dehydrogenase family protein [Cumulibacter manganitolerans]
MSDVRADRDLVATVRELFRERCPHEVVTQAEADGAAPEKLWAEVVGMGLHLVGIPEEAGGSGGTILDALAILHAAGEQAAPLPLAETMLAAMILADAGAQIPEGALAVVPPTAELRVEGDQVSGAAARVPWARGAELLVGVVDGKAFTAPVEVTREGVDMAGMPCDDVRIDGTVVGDTAADLGLLGALARSAQLAGALEAASDLTRQYVGERVQFGQPVGRFQAVQQHVVTLAQMAAMASLSVDRAALATLRGPAPFEIKATKQVIDKNATVAARAAHQAHGAIGMTQEYRLQQLTRRLYAWRGEYGDEKQLALELGTKIAAHGKLHEVIVAGSEIIK